MYWALALPVQPYPLYYRKSRFVHPATIETHLDPRGGSCIRCFRRMLKSETQDSKLVTRNINRCDAHKEEITRKKSIQLYWTLSQAAIISRVHTLLCFSRKGKSSVFINCILNNLTCLSAEGKCV